MKRKLVMGNYKDGEDNYKKRYFVVLILILLFVLALMGFLIWRLLLPSAHVGLRLTPSFSSNISEEQMRIDEQVQKSRITVSLMPNPSFDEATGELGINFVVVPENNGFSERFVISQEGETVYQSERVLPGYVLPTVSAPDVHLGSATATVFAIDQDGQDYGNPVSVELNIQPKQYGE